VIVANVRELWAISHSDRKRDDVNAEKSARYARLDPEILRPISHRTIQQQEALMPAPEAFAMPSAIASPNSPCAEPASATAAHFGA
jgi:hypothetical protein